jgi:hypothetical protein
MPLDWRVHSLDRLFVGTAGRAPAAQLGVSGQQIANSGLGSTAIR